ncbi:hypothetical protein LTR17_019157 [Elasticomyces elasticus]|nr:hypothetical protein LTR17_019157 [Elasticomyces elasticus]
MADLVLPDLVNLTEAPASLGAAARVFAIPELLEMILQPLRTSIQLFLLRRVNSTFQATIKDSKSLRWPPLGAEVLFNHYTPRSSPRDMHKLWYPMKIICNSYNELTADIEDTWLQEFFESDGAIAGLVAQPMLNSQTSCRELRLFDDDDAKYKGEIRIFLPRVGDQGEWRTLTDEVPRGATMGWFVEYYAAELRKCSQPSRNSSNSSYDHYTNHRSHSVLF